MHDSTTIHTMWLIISIWFNIKQRWCPWQQPCVNAVCVCVFHQASPNFTAACASKRFLLANSWIWGAGSTGSQKVCNDYESGFSKTCSRLLSVVNEEHVRRKNTNAKVPKHLRNPTEFPKHPLLLGHSCHPLEYPHAHVFELHHQHSSKTTHWRSSKLA